MAVLRVGGGRWRGAAHPGVHYLDYDAVATIDAATGPAIVLTTADAVARLTPEQARALGWGLIEAAGLVEPRD
jgi:hypothetical protein